MRLHSNASTCVKQRRLIRTSKESCRSLAARLDVSVATVHRWKHRREPTDRSCAPTQRSCALTGPEQQLVLFLRRQELRLDDLVECLSDLLPHIRRASVHRLLVRHRLNRLPSKKEQPTGKPGVFKEYAPGFLHIDCFYLPILEGTKRYAFVAVDRATRLVLVRVYAHKDKQAATDFLSACLAFYPFRIQKVLTDNGSEFTNCHYKRDSGSYPGGKARAPHSFDVLCAAHSIEHRLTRLYTPKTNGLAERMVGLIKSGTTKAHRYETPDQMLRDLACWQDLFNFKRRHRRLARKTPFEAACEWHRKQPELFTREPADMLTSRSQRCET